MAAKQCIIGKSRIVPVIYLALCFFISGFVACSDSGGNGETTTETARMALSVTESAGMSRTGEVVSNGIPIPRDLNIRDIENLKLVDAEGTDVPAQFEVLSRWGGGKGSTNPVQWLLISFPQTIEANDQAEYVLVASASTATLETSLAITNAGSSVTVDTGAAVYVLPKNSPGVLNSVALASGVVAGGAGGMTLQVDGAPLMTALAPDTVSVERSGPLLAVVKIAGRFDNPPYSDVEWQYVIRASFRAGSPLVTLDVAFIFPGNKDGSGKWYVDGTDTGANQDELVTVHDVTWTLPHHLTGALEAHVSATESASLTGNLGAGQTARLIQKGRDSMDAEPSFQADLGAASTTGTLADKAMVGLKGTNGLLAVSIDRMRFYEPQAIEADSSSLKVKIVADQIPLAPFMGAFARVSIGAFPGDQTWTTVRNRVLSELENGLMIWPTAGEAARSGALMELWDGHADEDGDLYAEKLAQVSSNTLASILAFKTYGFMTYGLTVRYWDPSYQEFGDISAENGYFRAGTFADYHHTLSNPVRDFARTANDELLRGLSFPAARRMLNTMIIQGDTAGPAGAYVGWAPAGYGAYRVDGNSSHSYFENLFFYYYLTGDRRVLDVLGPGGDQLRKGYARNPDGSLVDSQNPALNSWRGSTDRVASQYGAIYWFLGHTSDDDSFLDDFKNQMDRSVDRFIALLTNDGKEYAFISEADLQSAGGTHMNTGQAWMTCFYTLENLWRLRQEYGDVALGHGNIRLDRLFEATARTFWDYNAWNFPGDGGAAAGNGAVSGSWTTTQDVTWSGNRIGGSITTVAAEMDPGIAPEPRLWLTGKAALCAFLARAGDLSGDATLKSKANDLTRYVLENTDTTTMNWGKEAGLSWTRLHPAVARLTGWTDYYE